MKCFGQKIRNYHCKVVLLDDQELIQEIQSTSLGQELLETIFKHLNLLETSYFGLRYIDNTEQTHWLDPGKKIIRQLDDTDSFTLYFGVKFYAADPCKLVEEITRYQFFLQIKQDILHGRLPVPNDLIGELCAYAVQSELGDFDPRRHGMGYVSEFQFTSNQTSEMEANIGDLHKAMIGQVPAVAELNFLEKVKWLEMYGVDLHPVLGEDNTDYFLGLTPSGVIVLRNKTKVGNYFWPRISKLNQKGKYFMLKVKTKNNEEQTYGFETPSKAACKHLTKCAMEHHAFFRLVQVAPTSKSHSLNARFRDSARSDSSVRRRAQPQFVRTPSRRYQRRIVEGAQDDSECKAEVEAESGFKKFVAAPQPVEIRNTYRAPSMQSIPIINRSDSPRSIRSAPWPAANKSKQSQPSIPSPKSVRSAGVGSAAVQSRERSSDRHRHRSRKRSPSAESNSSCESRSHRRHHRHRGRNRRGGSDAESEVSKASGRSHGKRRHHKSGSRSRKGESGSESENCSHKHKHRHRKSENKKYELVDSEPQWKEVQKKLALQQASVVQNGSSSNHVQVASTSQGISATPVRKSGYLNSGVETESEAPRLNQNRRRHRRSSSHRSKSPEKRIPSELKRALDFKLIDTEGMSEEQLRQIPYHKVETNQEKIVKSGRIRHSSSLKSSSRSTTTQPPQTNTNGREHNSTTSTKLVGNCETDSPPPPYSPPTTNQIGANKPPVPQKPVTISNLGPCLGTQMKQNEKLEHNRNDILQIKRNDNTTSMHQQISNQYQYLTLQTQQSKFGNKSPSHHELGLPIPFNRSPSESPDSQKVDSHHENSDSGLGTDHHEYYKSENFSSLGYEILPKPQQSEQKNYTSNSQGKMSQGIIDVTPNSTISVSNSVQNLRNSSNYWSNVAQAQAQVGLHIQQPWLEEITDRPPSRSATLDRKREREVQKGITIAPTSIPATSNFRTSVRIEQTKQLPCPVPASSSSFHQPPPPQLTTHEISTEL